MGTCDQCEQLNIRYRLAVGAYTRASESFRGALEDDFKVILREVERLHAVALEVQQELDAHWVEAHGPGA